MNRKRLQAGLARRLAAVSHAERNCVITISTLAAGLAIVLPIIQIIEINNLLSPQEGFTWGVIVSYASFWLRVRIALALIINSIGIWPFRAKSILVSAFAIAWVVAEYTLWLSWSIRVREGLGVGRLPEPSAAGFYGAIWLDIVVLILAIVVLGWMIKTLLPLLTGVNQSAEQ